MSINMSGDDMGTDYSDFRYQSIQAEMSYDTADTATNSNVGGQVSFDPLQAKAGLDVNEVAELVHYRFQVGLEFEQESGDQDVGSATELRGVFGANLDASNGQYLSNANTTEADSQVIFAGGSADPILEGKTLSDDNVFETFRTHGSPAFDDEANGPGGGEHNQIVQYSMNYRDVTGRGPVLDSNDSLDVNLRLIRSDSVVQESGLFRAQLVWDIAEMDDAGRAFSVPMDD